MRLITLKLENLLKQTNSFTRFLLVGVLNTLVGLSIMFLALNILGGNYWLSTFIGNTVGAIISYLLNRTFTFHSQISFKKGAPRFFIVILLVYLLSYSVSETVAEWLDRSNWMLPNIVGKDELAILLGTGLYTISNYLGQKHLVFFNTVK